ncbi:LIM homeobox transcription factor 1-beta [Fasciola hepatica]|uniref:LIM homeobox transcription factor 1-beta n=1 Tax=Fasciola hepatica TaxID=6192 RepID=A0A4E0RJG9_FASHE|nr:LIM homeobox transcription factor 1-beta [Fasciola hepatica]
MESSERSDNLCMGCGHHIVDQYLLCIDGDLWHERCVVCTVCFQPLEHSCHVRDGKLFCKYHYLRHFGICCLTCGHPIFPHETILRLDNLTFRHTERESEQDSCHWDTGLIQSILKADSEKDRHPPPTLNNSLYFHDSCFTCFRCQRLLCPGEPYVLRGSLPLCYADYQKEMLEYNFRTRSSCPIVLSGDQSDYANTVASMKITKTLEQVHSTMESMLEVSQIRDDIDPGEIIPMITDYQPCSRPASSDGSSRGIPDRPEEEEEMFELDSDSGSGKNSKRPRTILTASQRRRFKSVFEMNPKPARKMREALATETGLNIRVVQVWFQNQRAKMKKLARRQAQEILQQSGRRLYSCNTRMIETQSTGHISPQGLNPDPSNTSPTRHNGSGSSSYNFILTDFEERTATAPPQMELPDLKTVVTWSRMTENPAITSEMQTLPVKQLTPNAAGETFSPSEINPIPGKPQSPMTFRVTPCSTVCTSVTMEPVSVPSGTQAMTVRLLPNIPILSGPFSSNSPLPCFEQISQVPPNASIADLILPSPVPPMDKLFSMQQSYFLS